MKAFAMDSFEAQPALRGDLPEPQAGDGEWLVRVRASSANPVDNAIAAGMLAQMVEHDFRWAHGTHRASWASAWPERAQE